ncbi:MAG: hypothetical protein AB8B83_01305 [Bdellovibrionales bacterium]
MNAYAQRCDADEEAIFKLREADLGAFAVWDGVHGHEDHDDRYKAGILLENSHVYVAGQRGVLGKPFPELILAEVDRRGRIVWETKRKIQGLDDVLDIIRFKDDFIVTARIVEKNKRQAIWVGFFDKRGAMRSERIFRHDNGSFLHASLAPLGNDKGFVMVGRVAGGSADQSEFSQFYRLNTKLQVTSKRSFDLGADNGLFKIIPIDNGQFYAAGYVHNARDRKTGWLLKLDDEGGIVWQQQYPRGIGAEFIDLQALSNGDVIAVGTALPAQEDALKAGWMVRVEPFNGAMAWQRYFTNTIDYSAVNISVNKDDLITIVMDAKPVDGVPSPEGEVPRDYVRVVTLNPRGVIFDSQAYFQGEVADVNDVVIGPVGERILVGTTRIAYLEVESDVSKGIGRVEKTPTIRKRSNEGWIIATPSSDRYQDPCKPKKERVLKSL